MISQWQKSLTLNRKTMKPILKEVVIVIISCLFCVHRQFGQCATVILKLYQHNFCFSIYQFLNHCQVKKISVLQIWSELKTKETLLAGKVALCLLLKKKECCDLQVSYLGLGSLSAHHLLWVLIFHKGVFPLASAKSCFFNILLKSLHQAFSRFKDI